jgi:hypothetical protein
MDDQTKQCPQCKGTVPQNAQECPLCGIIFKKYEQSQDKLKKTAISAYENGDLLHSRKLFETLIQSFPDLTDLAQSYLKSIEDQESHQLYQQALSEYEQSHLNDSKLLFEDLIQHYPNFPDSDSARKYIKDIDLKQMESESSMEQNQDSKKHQQIATEIAKQERFIKSNQDKRIRNKPIISANHYYVEGAGEVSWQLLRDLALKGDIEPVSKIFVGRKSEWISANQIPNLFNKRRFSQETFGTFLIVIGVMGLLFSLAMDTSVSTGLGYDVVNIGLLNTQQNSIIISSLTIIIGVLLNLFSDNINGSSDKNAHG